MDRIKLDYSKVLSFVGEEEIAVQREKATKALKDLEDGTCKGSDFLGWLDLPVHITDDELDRISACANKLANRCRCHRGHRGILPGSQGGDRGHVR